MKKYLRRILARNRTTPAERAKFCPVCAEPNFYDLESAALVYYQCFGCKSTIRVSKIRARPGDTIVVVESRMSLDRFSAEFDEISLSIRKLLS